MSYVEPQAGVLLDTCALIWFSNGQRMTAASTEEIAEAMAGRGVYVSAISAWEIGMIAKWKPGSRLQFVPDPKTWFQKVMAAPGFKEAPLPPDVAMAACDLPEPIHADPADRLLIATARHLGLPLVTRDRKIRAYADLGHVQVVAC